MSNLKKLMQRAAAGAAGGAALNVEDVFSTYLYTGNGSTQTITNNIDLSGEGGLVWIKNRTAAQGHSLTDTERGNTKNLRSDTTGAESTNTDRITSFNSNGFSLSSGGYVNGTNDDYASWTFRKAPKFFDIVTYTGDGVAGRTVSHNLGSVPGCIIIKKLGGGSGGSSDWEVYHRGVDATAPEDYTLHLNNTDARADNATRWNDTAPTSTVFTLGNSSFVNENTATYVAYLFAHNNGDGEFGPDGDADIIKCGSWTGAGTVNLGFEPQWVLYKRTESTGPWYMNDTMRGFPVDGSQSFLYASSSAAESSGGGLINITSTGFTHINAGDYVYIAIRRGPMAVPTDATDVFALGTRGASTPGFTSNFPVDMFHRRYTNGSGYPDIGSRLTGARALQTSETFAEGPDSGSTFDHMDGYYNSSSADSNHFSWMWRRAPNYFDVVAYTGNGTAGRTVSHNLGVAPEMIWVKRRNDIDNWIVYHSGFNLDGDNAPETDYGVLDNGNHFDGTLWNDTAPTATEFTVGFQGAVNDTFNNNYIAYLFASLDGVSKVGSYTGNGSTQTIDCGFSSGARFVLIKGSDAGGYGSDWYVWDTERGIVAANDPHLSLNTTAAEVTTDDSIDPVSSGFAVNQNTATNINVSSASYIFYAIA